MAVTNIIPIKVTVSKAISYVRSDKEEPIKDDVSDAINYAIKDKNEKVKIYKTISTPINCTLKSMNKQWESVRKLYGKNKGNLAYHIWQSFEEKIDGNLANEIGVKLAEELFSKYQCVVSTHVNTEHTHNHILINAVSFLDGKKYNDCLASYRALREASDRLCYEYNLSVNEKTKDFNLVKYKDSNGKFKFYEKTARKEEIREGEYSKVSDYRNFDQYKNEEKIKSTNRDIIRKDIDNILPYCKSFDDLLRKLIEIGYEIRQRKKNGEYLKYISFKAPMHNKFTRDYMLGEDYTRVNLSKKIEHYIRNNKKDHESDLSKYIERDIDIKNIELKKIYEEVNNESKDFAKRKEYEDKRTMLINRINSNLNTLKFIDKENIKSIDSINDNVRILYEKRKAIDNQVLIIKNYLMEANKNVVIIEKYKNLLEEMKSNECNLEYKEYELNGSLELINKYKEILRKSNLLDDVEQRKFVANVEKYNIQFRKLLSNIKKIDYKISQYDSCVFNIKLVDEQYENRYKEEIDSYYNYKKENRSSRNDLEKNRYDNHR